MKSYILSSLFIVSMIFLGSWKSLKNDWQPEKRKGYTLLYYSLDKKSKSEYHKLISAGINEVESFFKKRYKKEFNVFIHPDRQSLDSTWQKDWNMPTFKSECWMVASGIGSKLDMISPKLWDTKSCEHVYSENTKTKKIIIHELFHVYHGQINISPDFSNTEGIDWFVEGLATYASGQCDSTRIDEVKKAIL